MTKCNPTLFQISTYLHGASLVVVAIGTGMDIVEAADGKNSYWLPLTLAIMILMRIPNQLCVAFDYDKIDAWFTVVGSLIAVGAYIALTYYSVHNQGRYEKDPSQTPS